MIGLPFTVYCLPHALLSALGALLYEPGLLGSDSLLFDLRGLYRCY